MVQITSCLALSLLGVVSARLDERSNLPKCPPEDFSTVSNFDFKSFIQSRWHIQQQMLTAYLPKSENRCVYAEYRKLDKKTFWRYDIQVHNYAEDVTAPYAVHDSGDFICAKVVDESAGKLEVAPCFLPSLLSGPYWVIDFNDEEGYALISGGAPTKSAAGGCQTGSGTNNAGLWIFTRQQKRDDALVQKVRGIAAQKGFDLSVLNDVDQTDCNQGLVV